MASRQNSKRLMITPSDSDAENGCIGLKDDEEQFIVCPNQCMCLYQVQSAACGDAPNF